jgi:hypothetical protein
MNEHSNGEGLAVLPEQTTDGGTVAVATFKEKTGKYFLAIVHVDHDGTPDIVGRDYPNMDAAKSAAWHYAQAYGATFLSTKRVRS